MDINSQLLQFFEDLEEDEDSGNVDNFPEPGYVRGILTTTCDVPRTTGSKSSRA